MERDDTPARPALPGDDLLLVRKKACPCGGDLILSRNYFQTVEAARAAMVAAGRATTAEVAINHRMQLPLVALSYTCANAPGCTVRRARPAGCGREYLRMVAASGRLMWERGKVAGVDLW